MNLREKLIARRKNEKLSLRDAAVLSGVSASTLHFIETGRSTNIQGDTLTKLTVFLGFGEGAILSSSSDVLKVAGDLLAKDCLSGKMSAVDGTRLLRMFSEAYRSVT